MQNVNYEDLERGCNGIKVKGKKCNDLGEVELQVKRRGSKNTSTTSAKNNNFNTIIKK